MTRSTDSLSRALTVAAFGLGLAAGMGAAMAPASAQAEATPRADRLFERLDADDSGGVTKSELQAAALKRFDAMDADGDGKISRAEVSAIADKHEARREGLAEKRADKVLDRADFDKNGSLSKTEYETALAAASQTIRDRAPAFAKADADGDGKVTRAEIEKLSALRDADHARDRDRGARILGRFDKADADDDGVVTKAEFLDSAFAERLDRLMARADADKNGSISRSEATSMVPRQRMND